MDPFRDDLAAAHAKIAQLEKEIHELQTVVAPYVRTGPGKREIVLIVVLGLALVGLGFVAGQSSEQSADRTRKLESQPGIAIAPVAGPTIGPPASATSPALDKQTPYAGDKKPCNCTPGDPLCTCL